MCELILRNFFAELFKFTLIELLGGHKLQKGPKNVREDVPSFFLSLCLLSMNRFPFLT